MTYQEFRDNLAECGYRRQGRGGLIHTYVPKAKVTKVNKKKGKRKQKQSSGFTGFKVCKSPDGTFKAIAKLPKKSLRIFEIIKNSSETQKNINISSNFETDLEMNYESMFDVIETVEKVFGFKFDIKELAEPVEESYAVFKFNTVEEFVNICVSHL